MTDKEKAEDYAEKITYIMKGRTILARSELNQRYVGIVQGVLYGLAEGRQEKCNSCGLRQQKRVNLEKENTELKEQIEKMKCCCKCKYYQGALCECTNQVYVLKATKRQLE